MCMEIKNTHATWEICNISQNMGENNIFFQMEKVIFVEAVYNFAHRNVFIQTQPTCLCTLCSNFLSLHSIH